MHDCEPIDEPTIEDMTIVMRVLHKPTQHVFRCSFQDLQQITVESTLRDHVASGSADGRAAVAEFVREYIADNGSQLAELFAKLRTATSE